MKGLVALLLVLLLALQGVAQAGSRISDCCPDCPEATLCASPACQGCVSPALPALQAPALVGRSLEAPAAPLLLPEGRVRFEIWKPPRDTLFPASL